MNDNNTWQQASLSCLTDHIVSAHHAYLDRELPLLGQLLTAHVRQYWKQHPELMRAHLVFAEARAMVEQHLIKEETAGFPLIQAHEADAARSLAPFVSSINGHVTEHAQVTERFARIRAALWGYQPPDDVGAEVAFTCARFEALEADLAQHIDLENQILFPRVRAAAG